MKTESNTTLTDRELQILRRLSQGRCTEQDLRGPELSSLSVSRWLARLVAAGLAKAERQGYSITAAGFDHLVDYQQGAAQTRRVCNSASREAYTGSELSYRGQA